MRDSLRGKLGFVLMGGAMLSKLLIQFSVDGWSCVPSLLFTWGQTMVVTGVHPTPGLLPGKSHGWRSLVGYSARGHKESDTTVTSLHLHSMAHSFIELDKAVVHVIRLVSFL